MTQIDMPALANYWDMPQLNILQLRTRKAVNYLSTWTNSNYTEQIFPKI